MALVVLGLAGNRISQLRGRPETAGEKIEFDRSFGALPDGSVSPILEGKRILMQ